MKTFLGVVVWATFFNGPSVRATDCIPTLANIAKELAGSGATSESGTAVKVGDETVGYRSRDTEIVLNHSVKTPLGPAVLLQTSTRGPIELTDQTISRDELLGKELDEDHLKVHFSGPGGGSKFTGLSGPAELKELIRAALPERLHFDKKNRIEVTIKLGGNEGNIKWEEGIMSLAEARIKGLPIVRGPRRVKTTVPKLDREGKPVQTGTNDKGQPTYEMVDVDYIRGTVGGREGCWVPSGTWNPTFKMFIVPMEADGVTPKQKYGSFVPDALHVDAPRNPTRELTFIVEKRPDSEKVLRPVLLTAFAGQNANAEPTYRPPQDTGRDLQKEASPTFWKDEKAVASDAEFWDRTVFIGKPVAGYGKPVP